MEPYRVNIMPAYLGPMEIQQELNNMLAQGYVLVTSYSSGDGLVRFIYKRADLR